MHGHAVNETARQPVPRPRPAVVTRLSPAKKPKPPKPLPAKPAPVVTAPPPGPVLPVAGQPKGPPVSAAAQLAVDVSTRPAVTTALALIDSVHGDGALAPVPFDHRVSSPRAGATYWHSLHHADRIGVRSGLPRDEALMSVAHEIGHWLDHVGVPKLPGAIPWASADPTGHLQPIRDAIQQSDAVRQLRARPVSAYRSYTLEEPELFARAYAQFIATETRHPEMLGYLHQMLAGQTDYWPDMQWQGNRFSLRARRVPCYLPAIGVDDMMTEAAFQHLADSPRQGQWAHCRTGRPSTPPASATPRKQDAGGKVIVRDTHGRELARLVLPE